MPVFNKMVYNGTEYILGGGGNIGEPLNLAVTSAGLDATITWEDNEIGTIPPTTFQKSELVRKIGSAPTSPSDGTLVVTEIVKNTYKVSGYVDSGLTDGETYYYRVFSYSDLGGISYCDAVSVTPSGGWQPGVNTKLYLPLDGDVIDYSSYSRTFTVYGATASAGTPVFDTLSSGKQVADFIATTSVNSNWFMFINNPTDIPNSGNMTLSLWMCFGGQTNYYQEIVSYRSQSGFYRMSMLSNSDSHYLFHGSAQENTSFIPTIGTWYHIVNVVENGVCKIYCDGNQIYSDSYSYGSGADKLGIGGVYSSNEPSLRDEVYNGKLSEVIIEDKARTAQEIQDYYDQTKGDYGIS